jgi:hypothetical protein
MIPLGPSTLSWLSMASLRCPHLAVFMHKHFLELNRPMGLLGSQTFLEHSQQIHTLGRSTGFRPYSPPCQTSCPQVSASAWNPSICLGAISGHFAKNWILTLGKDVQTVLVEDMSRNCSGFKAIVLPEVETVQSFCTRMCRLSRRTTLRHCSSVRPLFIPNVNNCCVECSLCSRFA